ncbi:unnamed protein product [Durusdinium trenchii]|uniref:Ion transport domain-containing protein n=1 Tax=Durusdinium trenchii TaxID=1381693 RepID=A0ABP0JUB9_9DINO
MSDIVAFEDCDLLRIESQPKTADAKENVGKGDELTQTPRQLDPRKLLERAMEQSLIVLLADPDAVEVHISQPPVVVPSPPPQPPMPLTSAFVCSTCGRRYPWPAPLSCDCHGPSPEPDPRHGEPAPELNDQLWQDAHAGQFQEVDKLLKQGSDANYTRTNIQQEGFETFPDRVTVLGAAMLGTAKPHDEKCNHEEVVTLLLKSKAQLQEVDVQILSMLLRREDQEATKRVKALWVEKGEGLGKLRDRVGCVLAPLDGLDVTKKSEQWWTGSVVDYYNDLENQNMLNPSIAQVKHYILPLRAPLACDPKILAALASSDNLEMLDLDVVNAIISVAWVQHIRSSVIDNLVNVVNVVLLCWLSYNYGSNPSSSDLTLAWILAILHAKETSECMVIELWDWDIFNLVDIMYSGIGAAVIGKQLELWLPPEGWNKALLALFCGMAWLRLLASLRGYAWLGLRFLPIINAIMDSMPFFFITSTCLLASAHAYYQMGPRKEDPLPLFSAFVIPFRLGILGDFDLFQFEGKDTKYVEGNETETDEASWVPKDPEPGDDHLFIMVIFFVTSIGISLVLMNIFIAVLTQNLQKFQVTDRQLLTKSRAKMLKDLQKRPLTRLLHILRCCCPSNWVASDTISTSPPRTECKEVPGLILFLSLSPLRVVFGKYGHMWIWHQCTNRWITVLLLFLSPVLLSVSFVMMIPCLICGFFFFRLSGLQHQLRVLFFGIGCWRRDSPSQITGLQASDCIIHVFVCENAEDRSQRGHIAWSMERLTRRSMEDAITVGRQHELRLDEEWKKKLQDLQKKHETRTIELKEETDKYKQKLRADHKKELDKKDADHKKELDKKDEYHRTWSVDICKEHRKKLCERDQAHEKNLHQKLHDRDQEHKAELDKKDQADKAELDKKDQAHKAELDKKDQAHKAELDKIKRTEAHTHAGGASGEERLNDAPQSDLSRSDRRTQ